MNADNRCELIGTVAGENWTRWRAPRNGVARGQVRFHLLVARELAGEGCDRLLCAIEPHDELELARYQRDLAEGATVRICAQARALEPQDPEKATVIFVAESAGFGGRPLEDVHAKHRVRPHGKAAAAGDVELALEGGQS